MQNRRQVTAAGLLLSSGLFTPALAQPAPSPQSLAERFAATLSAHDIEGFSELYADTYVNHQTSAAAPARPANVSPKQGTVAVFKARLAAMPDSMSPSKSWLPIRTMWLRASSTPAHTRAFTSAWPRPVGHCASPRAIFCGCKTVASSSIGAWATSQASWRNSEPDDLRCVTAVEAPLLEVQRALAKPLHSFKL